MIYQYPLNFMFFYHISLMDGSKNNCTVGINYEAGRMITHILRYSNCIGFANCQIAMDAPFAGRIADESVRSVGRSETLFESYNENKLIKELACVFNKIRDTYGEIKLVIQMARGRSERQMYS